MITNSSTSSSILGTPACVRCASPLASPRFITQYSPNGPVVGTLPFTSITGQQGGTQSRRNDLESLAYTIIYSARGRLPWTGCRDHKTILEKKLGTPIQQLCQGLPTSFCDFVTHVRSLEFDEDPDYQRLHSILLLCLQAGTNEPIEAPPSVHVPVKATHARVVSDRV
jgi:hypothetical protein